MRDPNYPPDIETLAVEKQIDTQEPDIEQEPQD
jgi:hypothetical protein